MTKACLRRPGEERYWFADDTRQFIDRGFGIYADGPCFRSDPVFSSRWDQESIATGGSDYTHQATRIHFIIGEFDRTGVLGPAEDYAAGSVPPVRPGCSWKPLLELNTPSSAARLAGTRSEPRYWRRGDVGWLRPG